MSVDVQPGTNRLLGEKSPYLRGAARQPVDWYPWCDEAFHRAVQERKPILLDIGAVWCHWCHVMDEESYDDPAIARIINEQYIAIKVDRDERPDIDARYQAAVGTFAGQGGWPLTAFLTSAGDVFFGGTYFPPQRRFNRPGFADLLSVLAETFRNEPGRVDEQSRRIASAISQYRDRSRSPAAIDSTLLDRSTEIILAQYDELHGGFGPAPKFPHASALEFLLTRYIRTGDRRCLNAVCHSLDSMANGGIYDHLGGGFHRYSTDSQWQVPHFEKLASDNAALLRLYVQAFRVTARQYYKSVAYDIIRYVRNVLRDPHSGAFFASQDADNDCTDDGSYYTWSQAELHSILQGLECEVVTRRFSISERDGMPDDPNQKVLTVCQTVPDIAQALGISEESVGKALRSGSERLLATRNNRRAPFVDESSYADWNGMMSRAFLEASQAFHDPSLLGDARIALDRILTTQRSDSGAILHAPERNMAFLDDQIEIAEAAFTLYEYSGESRYLSESLQIGGIILNCYFNADEGTFFDSMPASNPGGSGPSMQSLQSLQSWQSVQDHNSVKSAASAITLFMKLSNVTEGNRFGAPAGKAIQVHSRLAAVSPLFSADYLLALDFSIEGPTSLTFPPSDSLSDEEWNRLMDVAGGYFLPARVITHKTEDLLISSALPAKEPVNGVTVCAGNRCFPPSGSSLELANCLDRIQKKTVTMAVD